MNFIDIVIIIFIFIFIVTGFRRGFLSSLIELGGIIVSVAFSLIFHIPFGSFLEGLGVSQIYSSALAFLIIWSITLVIYNLISMTLYQLVPLKLQESFVNKVFGIFPGFIIGIIIVTLIIALLISLPIPIFTSEASEESNLASPFLNFSTVITSIGGNIFGEPLQHAFGFFTIETGEDEFIDLNYTVQDPVVNSSAEKEMLQFLNQERQERGLPELVMDETLREVARVHSTDMFQRGYFAHVDPDGVTAFERMNEGGITYIYAGENLAFAPAVSTAHNGLMNSPGHKENILRPEFRRVGIGVVQGGKHGMMFTQKFTD